MKRLIRKFGLAFGLIFPILNAYGQENLVPNPSFEDTVQCPNAGFSNIESTSGWVNPTNYSPDYYNACATDTINGNSVPKNSYGYQPARTGIGYAGIILHIFTDAREYIQTKLSDSLRTGNSYEVSFFVSLADSVAYAVSEVGAYLSSIPVSSTGLLFLPFQPQIENDAVQNPLTVPDSWIEVRDTLIAQGGEEYITIGNFKADINTDTINLNNGVTWTSFSYYYVDDVSVVCLDCGLSTNGSRNLEAIKVFPNPINNVLYVDVQDNLRLLGSRFSIFDVLGNFVQSGDLLDNLSTIHVPVLPNGTYFLKIQNQNTTLNKKLIISN